MTLRLTCFGESGNAYKVALALELMGEPWEAVHVDFFAGETRSPGYRALNPMGEVPVLIDGDTVITQSGLILDHLASRTGKLGGEGPEARREVLRWLFFDASKVSGQAGPLRFNMNFLPEAKRDAGANAWLSMRLHSALKVMEAHLAGRDWLADRHVTIADCAACGYLFYGEPFTFDRAALPAIDAWLGRIEALPGWKHPYDLMRRAFPPGAPEAP
jgi:glutathione S-transferase